MRRVLSSVASAALLLAVTVGSASAARPATFSATFCYTPAVGVPDDVNYVPAQIVANVAWSGYAADTFTMGEGDGQAGFGFVDPLGGVYRSGTHQGSLSAEDDSTLAGVDIRIHNHILASASVNRPGSSWSGLTGC